MQRNLATCSDVPINRSPEYMIKVTISSCFMIKLKSNVQIMIPPIHFITDILNYLFQCLRYLEISDDHIRPNIHTINLSFMSVIEVIVTLSNFMEIYLDHFIESNRQWDAHKITYIIGYRYILYKHKCSVFEK